MIGLLDFVGAAALVLNEGCAVLVSWRMFAYYWGTVNQRKLWALVPLQFVLTSLCLWAILVKYVWEES